MLIRGNRPVVIENDIEADDVGDRRSSGVSRGGDIAVQCDRVATESEGIRKVGGPVVGEINTSDCRSRGPIVVRGRLKNASECQSCCRRNDVVIPVVCSGPVSVATSAIPNIGSKR